MYTGDQQVAIDRLDVSAYIIPTDFPESDGTLTWDKTTLVLVEATAGGTQGLGYSYADTATARLIKDLLAGVVVGREAMAVSAAWAAMVHAIRNLGRPGIVSMAISAVDAALWDLKARLLNLPLVTLLGAVREGVAVSRWPQRSILVLLALVGFGVSLYLSLYQLGVFSTVWEPFFGDGSRRVLHSELTRVLPVPDASLGAAVYLIEAVLGASGGYQRWCAQPWLVIFYGLTAGSLGLVSVLLVIFQSAFLNAWCTLCLGSAVISIGLILPVMDEVLASLQHLQRESGRGVSTWRAFWGLQPNRIESAEQLRKNERKIG